MSRFFILSSERSGTNLLKSLLSAHSSVAAPPPAPVMAFFQRNAYIYHQLKDYPDSLMKDLVELLELSGSAYQWDYVPDFEEAKTFVKGNGILDVIGAFYYAYASAFGKTHILCKESRLHEFPYLIQKSFPDSHFIYLIRDGRDVALSERKSPTKKRPIFLLAKRWKEDQVACLNAYYELLHTERFHILHYEDLVNDPTKTLHDLMIRLGLPVEEQVLEKPQKGMDQDQATKSHLWKNLGRPLMKGNLAKYKTELSPKQVRLFESVAGDILQICNYQLEFPKNKKKQVGKGTEVLHRVWNLYEQKVKGRRTSKREEGVKIFLKKRQELLEKRMNPPNSYLKAPQREG